MTPILLFAAASLNIPTGQPGSGAAKPTPPASTLGCLVAGNLLAHRGTTPQIKEIGRETVFFYLGRVDPRAAPQQLATGLRQTAVALKGVNVGALMNECLADLRSQAKLLLSVSQPAQEGK